MNYALLFRPEVDRTSLLMLGEGDRSITTYSQTIE